MINTQYVFRTAVRCLRSTVKKRRSWKEYRAIDLTMFAAMLVLSECVIIIAARVWFPGQPFTVSLAAAVTTIVYMRWGYWGGIHAVLAGFVYCFMAGANLRQYLIYMTGNLLSMLSVILLNRIGKERIRTDTMGMLYPVLVLLMMQTGRAAAALILGAEPVGVIGFFTTDSLSMLFTFVIIWIARRLDGIYEDQIHYLLRINAKEGREKEVKSEKSL